MSRAAHVAQKERVRASLLSVPERRVNRPQPRDAYRYVW